VTLLFLPLCFFASSISLKRNEEAARKVKAAAASRFKVRVSRTILFCFISFNLMLLYCSILILFSFWNVLLFAQVHELGFD
jgi:hypothetical protein